MDAPRYAAWSGPHVLVSDIAMPHEDGYELIHQVRSLEPERGGQIPAVALTGYATPEDIERTLAAGFQIHAAKPMDPVAPCRRSPS
jgi:CheY-like chemotaxis protein